MSDATYYDQDKRQQVKKERERTIERIKPYTEREKEGNCVMHDIK